MWKFSLFVLCSIVLVFNLVQSVQYKTVGTNSGEVRGFVDHTIWYKKPFYSFRGIPYAKPPIGERRFKV